MRKRGRTEACAGARAVGRRAPAGMRALRACHRACTLSAAVRGLLSVCCV